MRETGDVEASDSHETVQIKYNPGSVVPELPYETWTARDFRMWATAKHLLEGSDFKRLKEEPIMGKDLTTINQRHMVHFCKLPEITARHISDALKELTGMFYVLEQNNVPSDSMACFLIFPAHTGKPATVSISSDESIKSAREFGTFSNFRFSWLILFYVASVPPLDPFFPEFAVSLKRQETDQVLTSSAACKLVTYEQFVSISCGCVS